MGLNHLPPELLGLILANTFPDTFLNEWDHYTGELGVLNLRTVCRKYSKRVF